MPKMVKYKAIVQVTLCIEADNKKLAEQLAKDWDGEVGCMQAGLNGCGRLKMQRLTRLVSLKQQVRRKK